MASWKSVIRVGEERTQNTRETYCYVKNKTYQLYLSDPLALQGAALQTLLLLLYYLWGHPLPK